MKTKLKLKQLDAIENDGEKSKTNKNKNGMLNHKCYTSRQ